MDRIVAGSRVTVLACGRWLLIALTGSILACGSGGGASNPTAADADVGDVSAEITDDGLVDSIPIADALPPNLADGESEVDAVPCKMACDEVESACKEKAAENEDATAAAAADVACVVGKDECYAKCAE